MKSFARLALLAAAGLVEAKKKCPGHFGGDVPNLCSSHFPDKNSEKVWLVKFYAPWCGHCNAMKDAWKQLGKELKSDPEIGIGGVDCTAEQQLCGKYGVQGYPTIKAFVNGKTKSYNGPREKDALKQYVISLKEKRGSKGGSAKCAKGVFKSTIKDSVVPLCEKHFPDKKSKHPWVIGYYNKDEFEGADKFNRMALDFGNEPADKNKSLKKNLKQKEYLAQVVDKYNVKDMEQTKKAGKAKEPLAKFGAVCCDCDDASKKFCEKKVGSELPRFEVIKKGKAEIYDGKEFDEDKLALFTLKHLEYVEKGKNKEEL